jgi:hypothetical protein
MLDVHGVTGSSPVPRTTVKSPETITVSGLFVVFDALRAGRGSEFFSKALFNSLFTKVCLMHTNS